MPSADAGFAPDLPAPSLSTYRSGSTAEKAAFTTEVHDSLVSTGFVKLRDHGIMVEMVEELFAWNREFFQLSDAEKQKIANVPGPTPQRGYSAVGDENSSSLYGTEFGDGNQEARSDAREHWDQGPPGDIAYPNRWPDDDVLPGFRPFMEESFDRFKAICHDVLEALETAMGLPLGAFTQRCERNASEFRFLHYPAIDIKQLRSGKVSRIWPHYDLGVITLLFQDGTGGLEMEYRDGTGKTFVPVRKTYPAELIINISETMQRWTNGVMRGGLHRVTIPPALKAAQEGTIDDRFSIAYFCKANREASVGPFPEFVTEDRPAKYKDMTALQYQQDRLTAAY